MNLHTKLSDHLRKHEYKRGAFKGDAPADSSRRSRSHYRVAQPSNATFIAVRFHSTDIIRAYPDGSLVLDANGWDASPTTRDAYAIWGLYLGSVRHGSHRQMALRPCRTYGGPMVPFEDGMRLQYDSVMASYYLHPEYTPRPFMTRVADKDERREFRTDEDVVAFRQALPLLHAAVTAMPLPERNTLRWELRCMPRDLHRVCESHSKWPAIVAAYWRTTPSETWSAYYAEATRGMTKLEEVL
jgi:hypothetical protein